MRRGRVRVCVITGFGINADEELAVAFRMAGALAELVHVNDLIGNPRLVRSFRILAFPGGFSFGDHLGSGKVFALLCRRNLRNAVEEFTAEGGLVIGICNGFQVLVKMGILPNLSGDWRQEVSLIHNDSGRFEDRWVRVSSDPRSPCVWTRALPDMDLPVRHGEGKFVPGSEEVLGALESRKLVALRYVSPRDGEAGGPGVSVSYPENPNGSVGGIAGICDRSGRIFGLMPHPEAFIDAHHHPDWARESVPEGSGLLIIRNGVRAAAETGR